jgi:serum/glucocorticoid-regulated kinase 2
MVTTASDMEEIPMIDIKEIEGQIKSSKLSITDFSLLKVIGVGSYGKVVLVQKKDSTEVLAMKVLKKEHLYKRNQVEHTKTERKVLELIDHPFIVKLKYAFQSPKKLHMVMEYCPGGELFYHLSKSNRFDEERTKFYAAQIVLALGHLHKKNVVYRDLKPENVLIDSTGYIKLTDFGLSKELLTKNDVTNSFCGTPEYLAPEILHRTGHGRAVDWWSLGAIIFEMLTGLPPFYTKDRDKLFSNIKFSELKYPPYISPLCKDLLCKLFAKEPGKRLGGGERDFEEVIEHTWFAKIDFNALLAKKIVPPFQPKIGSQYDTKYVDPEFLAQNVNSIDINTATEAGSGKFTGFSYDAK